MAIAYRNSAVSSLTAGATSMTATLPTFSAGDLLVLVIAAGDTISGLGGLSGWTQAPWSPLTDSTTGFYAVYWRVADGSETNPSLTWTGTGKPIVGIASYSGVDGTTPIVASNGAVDTANDSTPSTPTVNNTGDGTEWALMLSAYRTTTSSKKTNTFTPDAALTERLDANESANASAPWDSIEIADSNGAVTTGNHSYSSTNSAGSSTHKFAALLYLKKFVPTPVVHLAHYRFRNDDGSETTATWQAAVDTVPPDIGVDTNFRLRLGFTEENGGDPPSGGYGLQYRRNGGSWASVATSGTDVLLALSPNFADLDSTTQQITSGSFLAGFMLESNAGAIRDLAASQSCEFEWCLQLDSAVVSAGDVIEFRLVDTATSTPFTSDTTPSVTATSSAQHVTLTPATESDAAQALDKDKLKTLTAAAETDAAQPLRRPKLTAATEADTAQAITHAKHVALAPAQETDAAQTLSITHARSFSITPATETDAAQVLSFVKPIHVTVTPAAETDTAVPLSTSGPTHVDLVAATEADSAQQLVVDKTLAVAPSTEADAAQALTAVKHAAIANAAEADTAQPLTGHKTGTLTAAVEADAAQPLSFLKPIHVTLTPAVETDAAQTLGISHAGAHSIVAATETDTALPLTVTHLHTRTLTPATEADAAQPLAVTHTHFRTLTPAAEAELALTLTVRKAATVAPATSVEAAQTVTWHKRVVVAAAVEADSAQVLRHSRAVSVAPAVEADTAQALILLGAPGPPGVRAATIIALPRATAALTSTSRAKAVLVLAPRAAATLTAGARAVATLGSSAAAAVVRRI